MRSNSVPDLPKLIFGQVEYFVAPANEKHTFCIPQITKNHQKSGKNASKAGVRKKEGLQDRLLLIFGDFGGPQGEPKITKIRKSAFQKSIEKKTAKKKAIEPVDDEGRRQSRSPGNPKIPFRKALAKYRKHI